MRRQHLAFGGVLEVQADELLLATDDAQLDRGLQLGVAAKVGVMPVRATRASSLWLASSSPTTVSKLAWAPRDTTLLATLAAPPMRSSSRVMRTTGTGAFGADAVDCAVPVAVDHGVAHDQYMGLGELSSKDSCGHQSSSTRAPGSCPKSGSRGIARNAAWPRSRRPHSGSG